MANITNALKDIPISSACCCICSFRSTGRRIVVCSRSKSSPPSHADLLFCGGPSLWGVVFYAGSSLNWDGICKKISTFSWGASMSSKRQSLSICSVSKHPLPFIFEFSVFLDMFIFSAKDLWLYPFATILLKKRFLFNMLSPPSRFWDN